MRLIFSDEFDYEGKPNPAKWTHQTGGNWYNDEIQYYTDKLDNAYVKDGKLTIEAKLEKMGNRNHTSARIFTYGKFSFQYGRIEMSAKLPAGKGSWPAFWMMPDSSMEGKRWPLCGEIDLMEYAAGVSKEDMHLSVHSQTYNHTIGTQETFVAKLEGLTDRFNKFTCDWKDGEISYYFNDEHLVTFYRDKTTSSQPKAQNEEAWPFDQPFHLLLNLAVGGMFGGVVDDAQLPYKYEIEYVRVWDNGQTKVMDW